MATVSARYLGGCGGASLVSHLRTRSCHCHCAATRAVRPRSQSCTPVRVLSPASSATFRVSDFERWLSTTGPRTGHSKSSVKEWIQHLSRFSPTVDVSSMSRMLTSLHVDLPRNLPEIRQLFPNFSFTQLQQIILSTNRFRRDKVLGISKQQSRLGNKQLTDAVGIDSVKESSSAGVTQTAVHDSAELHYEEQPVSGNVISSPDKNEESTTCAPSVQQHAVPDSDTSSADKSHILATSSISPTTDSAMSKFNTVASGIARQIAEYMPTVDINTAAQTKPATHLQQKQESDVVERKEKTKPSEVKKETSTAQKQTAVRRHLVARSSIDRQTRGLVLCLRDARTSTSQLVRLEELCQHISQYPDCTGIAVKVC